MKRKTGRSTKKTAASAALPRPRRAHGPPRAVYFGDPNLDRLAIAMVAMLAEISSVRERIDVHERLADQGRRAATRNVEKFRLEPAALAARSAREAALIKRVLRVLFEEADEIERARAAQGHRP